MIELLAVYGINVQALVGGSAGGIVIALYAGNRNSGEIISAWVVSALTANYLYVIAASFVASLEGAAGASGFVVGVLAKYVIQGLLDKAKKWSGATDPKPGGNNAP